jgi:two-component system LytT family sensor kinase
MELITDTLWSTFVSLLSAPFTASESTTILSDEVRGLIFTIVAVLFLIGLISLIGSFVEVRWQETRQKVLIDRAEITALRAQMEPHFLFNSLNTIAAMMREDPELAERLILQLSDIMNYHYQYAGAGTVSLQTELEFTHKYIDLITQRYKDKLKIDFVDKVKNRNQKVPVFLLQPLIENAIRHAWKPDGSPLHLQIILEDCHTGTCLSVKDDGVGISEIIQKKIFDINHALGNLNERLRLFYHSSNLISVLSEPDQGTEVLIKIPGD